VSDMENSEKFCDECGLPFAEREELHGRIVLARKEAEAAGSLVLSVQQESIALRLALSLAFKLEPQLELHAELMKFVLEDRK